MKKFFIIIGIITVFIIALVVYRVSSAYHEIVIENGSVWNRITSIFRRDPTPFPDDANPVPSPIADRLTVLVLGIRGEDDVADGGLLSDTMLLASLDKKTKKGFMVSIPRDLWIDMDANLKDGKPFHIAGKINESYARGVEHGQGLSLASQLVSRITGVPVDRAILFDFDAFKYTVDMLGGIDITLKEPFSEAKQWENGFSLPAGANHLDGEKTLYYTRSRYSSSDFYRARRQHEGMSAIKKKAGEKGLLTNPKLATDLLEKLKDDIRTNIPFLEVPDLLSLAREIDFSVLTHGVLTTENLLTETHNPKGEYILLPQTGDFKSTREYFKTLL